jgi:tetratricopeptide (TPR) repeat protein
MRLGELYRHVALYDLAMATYEQLLAERPETSNRRTILEALGECCWHKGNYQKAQLHFERAAGDRDDAAAWHATCRAGQAALADGRPADAVTILQRVVESAADRALVAAAYGALGDCHRQLGNLQEALAAYERAGAQAGEKGEPSK